jgi:hypothetical protein
MMEWIGEIHGTKPLLILATPPLDHTTCRTAL